MERPHPRRCGGTLSREERGEGWREGEGMGGGVLRGGRPRPAAAAATATRKRVPG
ncbi:MAG: hypothetical protein U0232_23225 [Thermomicrobiales bacterium]